MKKIIFLSVIILLTALKTNAQMTLSASQCREMALKNSYDVQIASAQYDMAVSEQKAVSANFFPKISGSATYAYLFEDVTMGMGIDMDLGGLLPGASIPFDIVMSMKGAYMAGITLQQPVFVGGKIVTGNKMAKKGVEMTEENQRLTRMNAMVEAEKAYWIYVSVGEKVKLLEQYVILLDSMQRNVKNFYEMQMVAPNDVQKVRAKLSNIKYELQRAKNGLELSRMSLCHIIGIEPNTQIITSDSTIDIPDGNQYAALDLSGRPEYRILQKQVEMKALGVKNTRADFLPTIGFSAGYTYVGGLQNALRISGYELSRNKMNMSLPMIMANISIPIFHFGEGARKIKSARIAHTISELELKKNSELMNIEIQQALSEYESTFLLIEAAQEAMEEADKCLKVAEDNYELKMGTIFDVLEAQAEWQQAHSNLIEARTNCKIKEVEYLKATGRLE